MKTTSVALMIITATILSITPAMSAGWTIDKSHSSIGFGVQHMMITTVNGNFDEYDATIQFDLANPGVISIDATIRAGSVNTRVGKRDEHLRGTDFFDVEKYPEITFKSTGIIPKGNDNYTVTGDLTIKGVTRKIELTGKGFNPEMKNPWGSTVVPIKAEGTIKRSEFGLTWNKSLESGGLLVSDEVTIELNLSLVKS